MFRKHIIYVRVFENRMEVKNLNTGKHANKLAEEHFSNDRLLIANFESAERFLKRLIKEVSGKRLIYPPIKMVIQAVDDRIQSLSQVEKAVFTDMAAHSGAADVIIAETQAKLTDEEVSNLFH